MKLVAPDNIGNFSCQGVEYKKDKDGYIDVPEFIVKTALEHGYMRPDDYAARLVTSKATSVGQAARTSTVRPTLKDVSDPPDVRPDIVDEMPRRQLVAYCIHHDLAIAKNAKVADLQKLVRAHMNAPEEDGDSAA